VGLVLGSFRLAGVLLVIAFVLGLVLGAVFIIRRRRPSPPTLDSVSLHLDGPA
jgi:hypothetical protein